MARDFLPLVPLPAFALNRTKRLIKAPKLYKSDTGLALQLAADAEPPGAHMENLILTDLLAWARAKSERRRSCTGGRRRAKTLTSWWSARGSCQPWRLKAAARVLSADARPPAILRAEHGRALTGGLVLYTGSEVMQLADRVVGAPGETWFRTL